MTYEQLLTLPSNTPVLLADGRLGLLIRYSQKQAGVQVPGEEDIRWISLEKIVQAGDTLAETR